MRRGLFMYDNFIHLEYVSLLRDSPLEGLTKVPGWFICANPQTSVSSLTDH